MRAIRFLFLAFALIFGLATAQSQERPSFLVDADWLEEHLQDRKLVLLEVRYHPHRYFTVGHIPGAVQVKRFMDLGDNNGQTLMHFPSRDAFEATLRRWGVNDDSTIVIYDDSRTALASRLFYLLELYGFDTSRVKILDGGVIAWQGFNELTKKETKVTPGNVTLKPANKALYVEWTTVYDRVVSRRDDSIVLLDARPRGHYTGEVLAHAVRGGHIPGAINIVSLDGTDGETQTWKSMQDLATLYKDLPRDGTIIAYCHDGFRMSLAYLQLKALGYKDVRLYNGGWGHWGNRLSLPVVKGGEPFDENFRL